MAYDLMIVATRADITKAEHVAKRLRSLKFKVRLDTKREHTTPTARDLNDANKSANVLVIWSKAACDTSKPDSDWVHALAHLARSRRGVLLQAGVDGTVPDEPFDTDERFSLTGIGPKRTPNGFYDLLEALEKEHQRKDLKAWMLLGARDTTGKAAWKKAHPKDPLSKTGKTAKAKTEPKAAPKTNPTPKAAASTVAAGAAIAGVPASKAAARPAPTSMPYRAPQMGPAPVTGDDEIETGWDMLAPILIGIAAMVFLAWIFRSATVTNPAMPAIGNAQLEPVYAETCPPGQIPRSLINTQTLRTGPVVDDTEEEEAN
ncbi:MAG: hypothetical protein WA989_18505 [Henriciella sp.]|uniref:hypothetical protein n=1 Tax=Henriciella sp. TaxID=1968823 RepID=UPI003C72F76D